MTRLARAALASLVLACAALLAIATAPVASAAGLCSVCSVEGVAIMEELAGGGAAGTTALSGAAAGVVPVSSIAVTGGSIAGQVASLGVPGALSLGMAGVSAWHWISNDTILPGVAVGGTFTDFTVTGFPLGVNMLVDFTTGLYGDPTQPLNLTTTWPTRPTASTESYTMDYQCVGSATWVTYGSQSSGGTSATGSNTGTTHTKAASACATTGFGALRIQVTINGAVQAYQFAGHALLSGAPATPGRTIQVTIQCQTPAGGLYSVSSSTSAAASLATGVDIAIAGLSCAPGDFAFDAEAHVATPGLADAPIVALAATPTAVPGWSAMTTPQKVQAVKPGVINNWTFVTADPHPTLTTTVSVPAPVDPTPGVDTGGGTAFCGMTFGDLLSGAVMFKAVGCAMSWAFVPDAGNLAAAQLQLSDAWSGTGVVTWVDSFSGVGTSLQGAANGAAASSCEGPHFVIALGGNDYSFNPLDACSPPMSTVAPIVKVLIAVFACVAGVRLVMRPVLTAFDIGGAA